MNGTEMNNQEQWKSLEKYFVIEEVVQLDGKASYLGLDDLTHALQNKDVGMLKVALWSLLQVEPMGMMSLRERLVLLPLVKVTAAALIEIIDTVLAQEG